MYLGTKLIAGGKAKVSLSDLEGIKLSGNLTDKSFLVYSDSAKAWVNKSLDELVFDGTSSGFVPAPASGATDLFLKSDGTWGTLPAATTHTILTLSNTDQSVHSDLIAAAVKGLDNIDGDIIIVKDFIATNAQGESKWQYTSYVYDNGSWHAMDGNYNAENVYFDEDLMTTTEVGVIKLTNGQATIPAAGKNLKEVFNTIFVKEANPLTTKPAVTITLNEAGSYEVGTKKTPTYSASLSAGSYTYGPATGITATSWEITDTEGEEAATASGSLPEIEIIDDINYTITAKASYEDGTIPLTNTGNEYVSGQIKAGSASKTSSAITGYRNSFYGTLANKNALTADVIRELSKSDKALIAGESIPITIPVGALRVVFAYPATLKDLDKVLDKNDSNANIISGFSKVTMEIPGNNNYNPISYKVYTIDFANPYDIQNIFTAII